MVAEEEVVLEQEVQSEVPQVGRPAHGALVGRGDVEAGARVGDARDKDGGAAIDAAVVVLLICSSITTL